MKKLGINLRAHRQINDKSFNFFIGKVQFIRFAALSVLCSLPGLELCHSLRCFNITVSPLRSVRLTPKRCKKPTSIAGSQTVLLVGIFGDAIVFFSSA